MKGVWLGFALSAVVWAAGPTEKTPRVPLPEHFREVAPAEGTTSDVASLKDWWTTFGDSTLDSLVERALAKNLDVRVAAARIAESRAAHGIAKSDLLPSINGSASVNRIRGGFSQGVIHVGEAPGTPSGNSIVSPFDTTIYQGGLDMRWEADLFGGVRKGVRAAGADMQVSEESRRDVLVRVAAEVARNYMDLRGVDRQMEIAQRNAAAQKDTLDLTRVRADAGLATQLDVERQAAQLAATEAAIPALESSRALAVHRLGVLVGGAPEELASELGEPARQPLLPPSVPAGLPSDLLRRRPDVRAADSAIVAAAARVGQARSDLFPKFFITGLSGRQATDVSGLTLGGGNFFGVGPGVQLPIFTGGRIRANIAVQNARLEQASSRYEQSVLVAAEEAENALASFRHERERARKLAAGVDASREAVTLARELYLRGLSDFLSVLDAQRVLFAAEDELARSDTAVLRNAVALYKALGGGWESH